MTTFSFSVRSYLVAENNGYTRVEHVLEGAQRIYDLDAGGRYFIDTQAQKTPVRVYRGKIFAVEIFNLLGSN